MNFINPYSILLIPSSFADFLVIVENEHCAQRKNWVIAPFVERVKTTTLRKSN